MKTLDSELVVIGAGPAGYPAAFYAADRGMQVMMVEQDPRLGGTCLNRGCIPSKAFLQVSKTIEEARLSSQRGVSFGEPRIDAAALRQWKESILERLGQGIAGLAKRRGVEVLKGRAYFEDSQTLRVETAEGQTALRFKKAVIATGSRPALPAVFDLGYKKVMTSTEALDLEEIPQKLLVVGGGYIGMELGTVYAALGSEVVVAEALGSILTGADADLVRFVARKADKTFKEIRLGVKVLKMATQGPKIKVLSEIQGKTVEELYDRVLVSVGRVPNTDKLGLENTRVERNEKGFITVNSRQETADPSILAVGDVTGGLMLAHKATKEARIAVEALAGESSVFENIVIPAVVFTDPEIAWCGLTEAEALEKGVAVATAKFPWTASGKALTADRTDGVTKLILDKQTERILGVGIAGHGAAELIAEGVLAIEMGAIARDLAECVHPHPTLSETLMECAELFYGVSTHALPAKR